ncbi:MAG TPA: adenylate/guanylate cyclase domain-containing protein [Afifellaceae bacterium]|nr:adenylate/guanylate cyclase domain-containing protein [Afifellaceae bacterium]
MHLSALVFDGYQRLKPRQAADAPITVIDIDEASLKAVGQWPWPRWRLAEMVDRLGTMGAAVTAFDIVFAEPDRLSFDNAAAALRAAGAEVTMPADLISADSDAIFGQAIGRNAVVAGFVLLDGPAVPPPEPKAGFAFGGTDPRQILPSYPSHLPNLPAIESAAAGLGYFSFPPGYDGVVRRMPLIARSHDALLPALSLEALRIAQGAGSIVVRSSGASGEAATGRPAVTAVKVGALEVPTMADGSLWVYYSGLPSLERIAAAELLEEGAAERLRDSVEGRIVLVGTSAVGLRDLVATPLAAGVPGVQVQAEILDQIIGQTFLSRPDWARGLEAAAAVIAALLLILLLPHLGSVAGAALAAASIAAIGAASWHAFAAHRFLFDPLLPIASTGLVYVAATAALYLFAERERRFIRAAFAHYLAPPLIEKLAESPASLKLGGETREITILFCDIRGFSTLSEGLAPEALTSLLNNFLTPMTDVLLTSGATIDKYIGDAIMAFWNAPVQQPDHARAAVGAALAMIEALDALNASTGEELRIGIGLNSGEACVGNLGSEQRFNYSAIGDAVNVASRIEGLTKRYRLPILFSERTAELASGFALLEVDRVCVTGRATPVAIYTALGGEAAAAEEGFKALSVLHRAMLAAYRAGDSARGLLLLAEAQRRAPPALDSLYAIYRERLEHFAAEPPQPDWSGVFDAA